MDETFVIVGADGTEHEFPAGMDPQKAAAIVRGQSPATAPPSAATEGMPEPSLPTDTAPDTRHSFVRAVQDEPLDTALFAASAVAPGILGMAGRAAAPAIKGAASWGLKQLAKPSVNAAIGAIEGGRHGGLTGAAIGAASGFGLGKGIPALGKWLGGGAGKKVAEGMSQAGRAAAAPPASTVSTPMIDWVNSTGGFDDMMAALAKSKGAAPAAAPAAAAPIATATATAAPKATKAASSLVDEVAARQKLADPINWRTTDITPIKKPGKGIHFGEESTPGLLRMLQDAQLAKDATLADKILKAIKQRSHITGKVGES